MKIVIKEEDRSTKIVNLHAGEVFTLKNSIVPVKYNNDGYWIRVAEYEKLDPTVIYGVNLASGRLGAFNPNTEVIPTLSKATITVVANNDC